MKSCIVGTNIKIKYDFKIPINQYVRKFTLVKPFTSKNYSLLLSVEPNIASERSHKHNYIFRFF